VAAHSPAVIVASTSSGSQARTKVGRRETLTPHSALGGSYPTVDRSRSGRRILVELKANVVEECRLSQASLVIVEV
jgi:hypothetical protein